MDAKKLKRVRNNKWNSQEGEIKVKDMETNHIINCINHLNKPEIREKHKDKLPQVENWIRIFKFEIHYRESQVSSIDLDAELFYAFFHDEHLWGEDW